MNQEFDLSEAVLIAAPEAVRDGGSLCLALRIGRTDFIQCAPMLFWLAEALGFPSDDLDDVFKIVVAAPKRNASQCAALRKKLPWDDVSKKLVSVTHGGFAAQFRLK